MIISKLENMKPKITLLISVLILFLLVPSISATQITNVAPSAHSTYSKGDPYTTVYLPSEIAPPNGTKSPIITILSLVNNTVIASNNLTLTFNLTLEAPTTYYPIILQGVCYKPSWQSDNITIDFGSNNKFYNKTLAFSISFTNITDGAKSITIYASTMYEFETGREIVSRPNTPTSILLFKYLYIYSNYYFIEGSSSVDFTINTTPTPTRTLDNNSTSNNGIGTLLYPYILTIMVAFVIAIIVLVLLKKHRKAN